MKHILVMGGPGSGKSTFARAIAERNKLTYIELDRIFWKPEWTESSPDEFRKNVSQKLVEAKGGWVVDGGYTKKLGDTVSKHVDTVIIFEIPLALRVIRVFRRGMKRAITHEKLWDTNEEKFINMLKLIRWMIQSNKRATLDKRQQAKSFTERGLDVQIFSSNKKSWQWLNSISR